MHRLEHLQRHIAYRRRTRDQMNPESEGPRRLLYEHIVDIRLY